MRWKDIEGYEGLYQVSSEGLVRSLDRCIQVGSRCYKRVGKEVYDPPKLVFKKGQIIKPYLGSHGYLCVKLAKDGEQKTSTVHHLVAYHFCEGYREGLEVNHKDANRLNNSFDNLEWVTRLENIQDVIKRGRHNVSKAQKVAKEVNKKKVAMLDSDGTIIKVFDSAKQAEEVTGARRAKISLVCNNKRKTTNGYRWKFVEDLGGQDNDIV